MKKFLLTLLACVSLNVYAADCQLPVMVAVDNDNETLSDANTHQLLSKLETLVGTNGYGGTDYSHLCLVAKVDETQKDVISGSRPLVTATYEITLVMTNLLGKEKYGSITISAAGSGRNEAQTLQSAISKVNPTNAELQKFLETTHRKIMTYYAAHLPAIVKQSEVYATQGNYERALYELASVPPCVDDYDAVADAMISVWQQYVDKDCYDKLQKARAIWNATQNEEGARAAAPYLAAIDYRAQCAQEAKALVDEIGARMYDNLRRIIEREDEDREFDKEVKRTLLDQRQQQIDAIRELALAYVQGVIAPTVGKLTTPQPVIAPPPTIIVK